MDKEKVNLHAQEVKSQMADLSKQLSTIQAPSLVLEAIDTINESLAIVLAWIKEEKSREGKSANEVIERSEELGEEVRRMNLEDIES